jgi:CheY-like chemotaxis protein
MSEAKSNILVVDDTPANVKLLVDLLGAKGYAVTAASSGEEALVRIGIQPPDLVLLDIMMPGLSGYDVCRRIRADPATALLPVVLCTSLDPKAERVKGIEAGADDFIPKPINQQELFARVKSLLRIKALQDEVKAQAAQLADWNLKLEQRVQEQLAQMERLSRLKNFFSPQLAEAIVSGGAVDPLKSHRREITVVFLDLRGFTAFTETADPEEVMGVLREYHAAMGEPRARGHAGALHRRRHHDLLQRPGGGRRPGAARGAHGAADAAAHAGAGAGLAQARLRVAAGHRRRHRLRDDRRHRLRRAHRLRRHRQCHQPGGTAVRRGQGRRDPAGAARRGRAGRRRCRAEAGR